MLDDFLSDLAELPAPSRNSILDRLKIELEFVHDGTMYVSDVRKGAEGDLYEQLDYINEHLSL